jgi:polyhydroxyalkanoate synthesis regulator protein
LVADRPSNAIRVGAGGRRCRDARRSQAAARRRHRRLKDAASTSLPTVRDGYTFVTLDELAAMVKRGGNFLVYDATTGADITGSVRAQIAFQHENFHGSEQP